MGHTIEKALALIKEANVWRGGQGGGGVGCTSEDVFVDEIDLKGKKPGNGWENRHNVRRDGWRESFPGVV